MKYKRSILFLGSIIEVYKEKIKNYFLESSMYVRRSSQYFGFFLGLLRVSFRPLFYDPYAAKIVETYCTGIRENCSGVKSIIIHNNLLFSIVFVKERHLKKYAFLDHLAMFLV